MISVFLMIFSRERDSFEEFLQQGTFSLSGTMFVENIRT